MIKLSALILLAGMAAAARPGLAAVNSTAGLANPMENSGISARALGMGSAFVGVADDSSALFWNSAGLGGVKGAEMALHHNSWLAGIIQETAVFSMPLGSLGGFAASVNYVNYGQIPGYDVNGAATSDYSANRYGLGLGWGKEVMEGLSAGVALKGAMRGVDSTNYSDMSLDLGALWTPWKAMRLGLSYSNLGTAVAGYAQASALSLGGSYQMGIAGNHQILLAASGAWEPNGVDRVRLGLEDLMYSMLALRAGYQFNLADSQIQGLTGLTAGLGILYGGFGLDYAFVPFGDLGTTQRLSLSYAFGRGASEAASGQ